MSVLNEEKNKIRIAFVPDKIFIDGIKNAKEERDLHYQEVGISLIKDNKKLGKRLDYVFMSIPDFLEQLNNKTEEEIIDFHGADDPVNYLFIPSNGNVLEIIIDDKRSNKEKIGEITKFTLIKESIRFAEEFIKTLEKLNKKTVEFESVKNIMRLTNELKQKGKSRES